MFSIFKKRQKNNDNEPEIPEESELVPEEENDDEQNSPQQPKINYYAPQYQNNTPQQPMASYSAPQYQNSGVINAVGNKTAINTAATATQAADAKYKGPEKYDRKLYDDGTAKRKAKEEAFKNGKPLDPYTGNELELRKPDAKMNYGPNWTGHLAEADHITPLKKVHEKYKNNPWLSTQDKHDMANSQSNIEINSRKANNAKRDRTNKEFVTNDEYLKKTGLDLTEEQKKSAIKRQKKAEREMNKEAVVRTTKNVTTAFHESGTRAAKDASSDMAALNLADGLVSVIKGNNTLGEAAVNSAKGFAKCELSVYAKSGGLNVINHTLNGSNSKFLKALGKNNVPAKVLTAVSMTGTAVSMLMKGEISTDECIVMIGKNGIGASMISYGAAAGQVIIPIPVIGATVGSLVGMVLVDGIFNSLMKELETERLAHEERMLIQQAAQEAKQRSIQYRQELQSYLDSYYGDYKHCLDEALAQIQDAYASGDANGVIQGANQITQKLGGQVKYENVDEFKSFLLDDGTDSF